MQDVSFLAVRCVLWLNDMSYVSNLVFEEVYRKCFPRKTTAQLLTPDNTDSERHDTQRYKQTDRRTGRRQNHGNSRSSLN